jgi:hypothetical protein
MKKLFKMNTLVNLLLVSILILGCETNTLIINDSYPAANERIVSKENITYYINPVSGSDDNKGTKKEAPWKTFKKVNQLILTKGNRIEVLEPGTFRESLFLIGQGAKENPITIHFAQGKYNFHPENSFKSKFHISNTNDAPDSLKAVAFYLLNSKHVKIEGNSAEIILRGKAIITSLNNCENISIENINFDYKRPTVSEIKVIDTHDLYSDVQIHRDSKYKIVDSTLIWVGEGWKQKAQNYWQVFNPTEQKVERKNIPIREMLFSELTQNQVRIHHKENLGFKKGFIYQNRNTFRDYSAVFMQKSKNILWNNVNVYFMHGMGFVSQFCENITFDTIDVKPRERSGRTCAAWADILHFSGCKGQIKILNSYLSAANDDAINVHGTHLRIIDSISNKKIKVRFMHPQTYGFDAFVVGDSIEFVKAKSLLPFSKNIILGVKKLNEKEIELVLEKKIPNNIEVNDVIENISWTPDVTIRNNKIVHIPTRGILMTTRGKVIIDNNEFNKTHMSGILISDDANSWFESGYVKDVTISNNKFIGCGSPVINIHPENSEIVSDTPVHRNIQIINNEFILGKQITVSAKSTENIKFSNNTIESDSNLNMHKIIRMIACSKIEMENNLLNNKVVNNVYK